MKRQSDAADKARGFEVESRLVKLAGKKYAADGYSRFPVTLGLNVAEALLKKLEEKKNGVRKSKPAAKPRRSK